MVKKHKELFVEKQLYESMRNQLKRLDKISSNWMDGKTSTMKEEGKQEVCGKGKKNKLFCPLKQQSLLFI